jgi:hypothetical protein
LRHRTFRTVFGTIQVSCRRYFRCKCQGGIRATVWPLHRQQLSGTSPELQYLYASWGSKVSYRRAAALLARCFRFAIEVSRTLRCVAAHLRSEVDSICE